MPGNRSNDHLRKLLVLGISLSYVQLLVPQMSRAQALEVITVTSSRRASSLQEVSQAVTAVSAEALLASGVSTLQDLALMAPGVSVSDVNLGQAEVYIRGIGTAEDGAGSDSPVAIFIDDVYVGRTAGAGVDFGNLQRIEVVRGPQGALFGKNVVGGAIHYISRTPEDEFNAHAQLGAGNLGSRELSLRMSAPVSPTLAVSGSLASRVREGYTTSVLTGIEYNDVDSLQGTLALRYTPREQTRVHVLADWQENAQQGPGHKALGGYIGLFQQNLDGPAFRNWRANFADFGGFQDRAAGGMQLRVEHDLEWGSLSAISGWRRSDFSFADDLAANARHPQLFPLDAINGVDEAAWQLSQELRVASHDNRPWSWIAGMFYMVEDTDRLEYLQLMALPGVPAAAFPLRGDSRQINRTGSHSAFAQITRALGENWELALGGRYTQDRKRIRQSGTPDSLLIQEQYSVRAADSWRNFSPSLQLSFQPSRQVLVYASAATGFKSGGYQGTAPTGLAASKPFDEESALSTEIGVKLELYDSRLRVNTALFNNNYENLQVLQQLASRVPGIPGPLIVSNAAAATLRGAELEFAWLSAKIAGLELSGHYGYLDSRFDSYVNRPELVGNQLRNAPRQSWSVGASYARGLGGGGSLTLSGHYRYQSSRFQDTENLRVASIPAYGLTDMRITFQPARSQLSVALWVKNATDQEYLVNNYPSPSGDGSVAIVGIPGAPRHYGISIRHNW